MSEHIPGEWLQVRGWSRHDDRNPIEIRKSNGGVAWSWVVATPAENQMMLAAPDMLAALQGAMVIIDTIPWPQDMTEKLEQALVRRREAIIAAIRKAEGATMTSTMCGDTS